MRFDPYTKYRPVREADGEGGFDETTPTPKVVYAFVSYHQSQLQVVVDALSDILIGDILKIDTAYYRVTGWTTTTGERHRSLTIERTEAPINPNVP